MSTVTATRERPRRLLQRGGRVLLAAALIVLVGLLLAMVIVPRLFGWVPLTVLSGSMSPAIPVGSQVVVEPVETEADLVDIGVGDVITFMPHPDDDTLITHRVASQGLRADGTIVLTTRGDANGADDPWQITAQQARGVVRYHVPYAGYVSGLLNQDQRQWGVVILAGGLFGYAGWQVAAAYRARHREAAPE